MNRSRAISLFAALSLVAASFLSSPAHALAQDAPAKATVGEIVPDFGFRPFLTNGDGRQRLADFRGQPVLIVNWTDTDFGRGAADQVRKAARSLVPKGLVLVLRDTHNQSADEIQVAAMRRYPGSPGRFVENLKPPFEYEDNGPPPDIALIDVEGRLIVAGSYTVDLGRAEKRVVAELERRQDGWGQHAAAREARARLHGDDRLAEALACCDEALASEPESTELVAVRAEILAHLAVRERVVQHHLEQGEPRLALARAQELQESVAGHAEWEERVRTILAGLDTPEVHHELDLDDRLAALLRPLEKKAPRATDAKKLARFAEDAGQSRVGVRARELARLAALAAE